MTNYKGEITNDSLKGYRSSLFRFASLCCSNIPPEIFQALVAAEQYAEDGGVCHQHITRSVAAWRHPEEHIELPVSRFCERMRPGHVDRLSGQNVNGPGVIGSHRVVRQMHMKVKGGHPL